VRPRVLAGPDDGGEGVVEGSCPELAGGDHGDASHIDRGERCMAAIPLLAGTLSARSGERNSNGYHAGVSTARIALNQKTSADAPP